MLRYACPDDKEYTQIPLRVVPKQKSMKLTKSFTVETKRNGRRTVKTVEVPIWEPHVLQSAMKAVQESSQPEPENVQTMVADTNPRK